MNEFTITATYRAWNCKCTPTCLTHLDIECSVVDPEPAKHIQQIVDVTMIINHKVELEVSYNKKFQDVISEHIFPCGDC